MASDHQQLRVQHATSERDLVLPLPGSLPLQREVQVDEEADRRQRPSKLQQLWSRRSRQRLMPSAV
eukprot:14696-Rhodomonas_salina.1